MFFSPGTVNSSITLTIFIILLIASSFSTKSIENNSLRNLNEANIALTTMKVLALLSLLNLTIFIVGGGEPSVSSVLPWLNTGNLNSFLSINIDSKFIFFSSAALLVTWSIIEFSIYYMSADPNGNNFFRLLMIFLLNMLILTSANNIFLFFIGWEGVGFLSFLLISWWSTRTDANASALQAIVYNRIGDIGIIVVVSGLLINTSSWDINSLSTNSISSFWMSAILFTSLIGAIGKSAQFGLHPWLPAAMEGPTPVSALLHSSTMVVAGVFLLIRMTTIITPSETFLNVTLIIGSLTAIFAATSAFQQHDIKKIIAYSTTSQLGLMVVAIGLGNPNVALFHICTHAFFKAMLFLCSGSIIHSHNNEQDLRKMSNISESLPITSSCLFLGSIALMGVPFLSGFYSKDLILELVIENPSNLISFSLAIIATLLTAAYSFRIVTFCFLNNSSNPPINPMNEENPNLTSPLVRLAIGAIFAGWLIGAWLMNLPSLFPIGIVKAMPIIVTVIGATIVSALIISNNNNTTMNTFFSKTWFYTSASHIISSNITNATALTLTTRALDRGWSETAGGQGMFVVNSDLTKAQQITQTGYIKQYLLSISLIVICILTTAIII
uniref:NADH-ubiquinone oxidoreductase chain 5 n=1 Tax=Apostichopus parvimensis TaxID=1902835 RepID=A0A140F807_APOPA|nr:NADH dehydrogenase subunit 5 [Apostichopus parvimensis]AML79764.1 NADH dehydrogenase subunit 5 [Apostichopus parvimensis]